MTDVYELLTRELGAARVVRDEDSLEKYARDESDMGRFPPDAAVLAESLEEVTLVLRLAREHRIPVTPRGAGTGRSGGALALSGGIVLSTERMTKIREVNGDDMLAVVEPGVITADLHKAVEAEKLFYPPDPASLSMCSLGGNIAHNAGGPRAFKYGVTRNFVLGVEASLMGGETLRMGRRSAKGVTGYDLTQSFVGTEGTFGVTTEITLRLLPLPQAVATLLCVFDSAEKAGHGITAILHHGILPRAMELVDRLCIEHVREKTGFSFPENAGAVVIVELDGDAEGLEGAMLRAAEVAETHGAIDVLVARDDQDRRRLWNARRMVSPILRESYPLKVAEDICVPRGAIPELLRRVDALSARWNLPVATFGHAGDGNLHVNLLSTGDPKDPELLRRVDGALEELFRATVELRGTLSGEHGIGIAKQKYMALEQTPEIMDWQKRLKRLWDPENLLNPGKIFPV